MVFELNHFARVASCSANGTFFFVLEGLDDALPAEKMAAFCRTPVGHLAGANSAE